jgi:hypothetical protein
MKNGLPQDCATHINKRNDEKNISPTRSIVQLIGAIELEVMLTGGCSAGATVNVNGGVPDLGVTLISVHRLGHLHLRVSGTIKASIKKANPYWLNGPVEDLASTSNWLGNVMLVHAGVLDAGMTV